MDYFLDNWGSFVGVISLIVTIIGFIVAIHRAGQAQRAAVSAEEASQRTAESITKVLAIVDLERALGLINRLKVFHRSSQWNAAIGHYPDLRYMLTNIIARHPEPTDELRTTLNAAILKIRVIEDSAIRNGSTPRSSNNFNRDLTSIEADLVKIASSTQFPGSEVDS